MCLTKLSKKTDCEIKIFGDSKLVVNQMNELWGSNGGAYYPYMLEAKKLLKELVKTNKVTIEWIPRDKNELADNQSKLHIKEVKKWK
jgi:ribonuclease HI